MRMLNALLIVAAAGVVVVVAQDMVVDGPWKNVQFRDVPSAIAAKAVKKAQNKNDSQNKAEQKQKPGAAASASSGAKKNEAKKNETTTTTTQKPVEAKPIKCVEGKTRCSRSEECGGVSRTPLEAALVPYAQRGPTCMGALMDSCDCAACPTYPKACNSDADCGGLWNSCQESANAYLPKKTCSCIKAAEMNWKGSNVTSKPSTLSGAISEFCAKMKCTMGPNACQGLPCRGTCYNCPK